MSDTRKLIDFAAEDNGVSFRDALYSAIHDRVTAHIEAKKQEVAQNLITRNEEVDLTEGKMDKATLSSLWHKHAHHSYLADQGYGLGHGSMEHNERATTAIENHVRKHYGNKVADDMISHSDHHVAHAEYAGVHDAPHHEKEMEKLRSKHGITGGHNGMSESVELDEDQLNEISDKLKSNYHTHASIGTFVKKLDMVNKKHDWDHNPIRQLFTKRPEFTDKEKAKMANRLKWTAKIMQDKQDKEDKQQNSPAAYMRKRDGWGNNSESVELEYDEEQLNEYSVRNNDYKSSHVHINRSGKDEPFKKPDTGITKPEKPVKEPEYKSSHVHINTKPVNQNRMKDIKKMKEDYELYEGKMDDLEDARREKAEKKASEYKFGPKPKKTLATIRKVAGHSDSGAKRDDKEKDED